MPALVFRDLPPAVKVATGLANLALGITVVFMFLSLSAVALRIWARCLRRRTEGIEDALIYVATPIYMVHAILGILQVVYGGVGTDRALLSPSNISFSYKMLVATNITYGVVLTLTKCSMLFLYSRIFAVKGFRLAVKIAIGFVVIWGILAVLSEWITCRPVSYAWDKNFPNGTCEHAISMLLAVGILDVLGDLIIFILPIPVIKLLQVSRTEKRLLYGLFGIGALSIIASAVRVTTFVYSISLDNTLTIGPLVSWTELEPSLSIIVSCGMLLRPVVHKVVPRRFLSSHSQEQRGGNSGGEYVNVKGTDAQSRTRARTDQLSTIKSSTTIVLHEREGGQFD